MEGAGWQMGPLGVHGFVTPYKASRSSRRARSLPLPGDGSGITLPKSSTLLPEGTRQGHPHACRGHRSIPSLLTSREVLQDSAHTHTAKGYLWCQREVIEAEASAKRDIL